MKKMLISLLTMVSALTVHAEAIDGLFVWVMGAQTCYKLESQPKVVLNGSTVMLYVREQPSPVLTLPMSSPNDLKMTFGTYSTGIDGVSSAKSTPVKQQGKIISGGKLIIIGKDGHQYDVSGKEIVNN